MKSKKITVLVLLVVLSSGYSCSREIRRCFLTEAQHQLIPYEMGQVISFIDDEGRTVDLTVTEIITDCLKETYGGSFRDVYVTSESKTVILKSESNNIEVKFQFTIPNCFDNLKNCWLVIRLNYSWRFILQSDPDGVFLTNSTISFYNSFKINNNVYYDVVEQKIKKTENNDTSGSYEIPMQLYYNKSHGILQINIDGNNFLTINH